MKTLALVAFLLGTFGLVNAVNAAEKEDPNGTWKLKIKAGKKDLEQTFKFENKDGKVTGTVTGGKDGKEEAKIEDGTFKDGELSFTVKRERGDIKLTSKFSGKITGDAIKGTVTTDFNGKEVKSDFEGKREKK